MTVTVAILHPKFEKVLKTPQNIPKTVDNHQKQFYDPEIGTADDKNAIKTPFFAILSSQKGMGGFVIDI